MLNRLAKLVVLSALAACTPATPPAIETAAPSTPEPGDRAASGEPAQVPPAHALPTSAQPSGSGDSAPQAAGPGGDVFTGELAVITEAGGPGGGAGPAPHSSRLVRSADSPAMLLIDSTCGVTLIGVEPPFNVAPASVCSIDLGEGPKPYQVSGTVSASDAQLSYTVTFSAADGTPLAAWTFDGRSAEGGSAP